MRYRHTQIYFKPFTQLHSPKLNSSHSHAYPWPCSSCTTQAVTSFLRTHGEHHWSPLDHNSHVAVATLAGRRQCHLNSFTRPSWGPPLRHNTTGPFPVAASTPILFSQSAMLSIISCRFPNGPLPKRLPPKLNTHHTHNFKCFSPFHFPFFFINSFNFLAFANQLNIPTSTH